MVSVFVHTTPRDVTVSSVRTFTMISLGDQQGRMPLMLVKVGIKTPMKNKSLVFQAQLFYMFLISLQELQRGIPVTQFLHFNYKI